MVLAAWQISACRQQRKQIAHSFEGVLQFLQSFQLRLNVALQQSVPRAQPTPATGIGALVGLSGLLHTVTCLSEVERHLVLGWIQQQSVSAGVVCMAYCCFMLLCVLFMSAGAHCRFQGRPRKLSKVARPGAVLTALATIASRPKRLPILLPTRCLA